MNAERQQQAALATELKAARGGWAKEQAARAALVERFRRAQRDGDLPEGELEIGQVSAMLDDVAGAGELVDRIVDEYRRFGAAEMAPGFHWDALAHNPG